MSSATDEHGRPEPPFDGDEWTTLTTFLDFQRATFAWKTAGLDSAQLARSLPPSSMTLAGLIKHLTFVEDHWFDYWLDGRPEREPWASVDWKATPDWEWDTALDDDADELRTQWQATVERARAQAAAARDAGGLDQFAKRTGADGHAPNLRWILTHMIEEYSRHNGHADLLREAVDGATGE